MEDEMPGFTMGDLLKELANAFGAQPSGTMDYEGVYTTTEIAKIFGASRHKALKEIKKLHDKGMIEITQKTVERFGGTPAVVQAYKLKPKEKTDEEED